MLIAASWYFTVILLQFADFLWSLSLFSICKENNRANNSTELRLELHFYRFSVSLSTAPADATKPAERGHRHHRHSAASAGPAGTAQSKDHLSREICFFPPPVCIKPGLTFPLFYSLLLKRHTSLLSQNLMQFVFDST